MITDVMYVLTIVPKAAATIRWNGYRVMRKDSFGWTIVESDRTTFGYFPDKNMNQVEVKPSKYDCDKYIIRGFDEPTIERVWNEYVDMISDKAKGLNELKFNNL